MKRAAANWAVSCEQMPFGCPSFTSLYSRKDIVVGDVGLLSIPTSVVNSSRCPYRGEVANTRPSERWHIWHDGSATGKMGKSCKDGCALQNCRGGLLNPCCVKRLKVKRYDAKGHETLMESRLLTTLALLQVEAWPVPCASLRFGCSAESPRNVLAWARRGEKAVYDPNTEVTPMTPYSISREHPEEEVWR